MFLGIYEIFKQNTKVDLLSKIRLFLLPFSDRIIQKDQLVVVCHKV